MPERITYEQVRRAMATMPDLVDVIRLLRSQVEAIQADGGHNVRHDLLREHRIGLHWDRGN